jgi:hypothetical protein
MSGRAIVPVETRFWRYVEPGPEDECWPWRGSKTTWGYGQLILPGGGKAWAHRVAYKMFHGPVPLGLVVRHKCDNPPCVNPAHLETGTTADNARDKALRHRVPSKLSDDQVREVRAAGGTYRSIGTKYGISASAVCLIKAGRLRQHTEQ